VTEPVTINPFGNTIYPDIFDALTELCALDEDTAYDELIEFCDIEADTAYDADKAYDELIAVPLPLANTCQSPVVLPYLTNSI